MADKTGGEDEDVYELPLTETDAEIPTEWRTGAMYELEQPARCPFCREAVRALRVIRLSRTQVSFTSTLPRGGRVIVCPHCERILSAEIGGLL
jgi:glutaredoxin